VGKSFGVEHALERDSIMDKLAYDPMSPGHDPKRETSVYTDGEWKKTFNPRYKIIKGNISANGLYKTLFEYQEARDVLVFDDTDVVLQDETMLTFLKVALDTTERRILHWITHNNRSDALPNSFEFKGSVIFITNLNFERIIASNYAKLSPHLEAILSRCLYLDLTIDTVREKLIRIEHVARDLGMLTRAGLTDLQVEEVLEFTHTFADRFRELSLRKVLQVADLRKMDRNWRRVAELTVLRSATR
jgi:DNA-binding transcriptional ArsR family regulator